MKAFILLTLILFTSIVNGQNDHSGVNCIQRECIIELKYFPLTCNLNIIKNYSLSVIPFENLSNKLVGKTGPTFIERESGHKPDIYFIINNNKIHFNPERIQNINPKWIKKIEVLKEKHEASIYGNKNGVVLIYPKKKYSEKIYNMLLNN